MTHEFYFTEPVPRNNKNANKVLCAWYPSQGYTEQQEFRDNLGGMAG